MNTPEQDPHVTETFSEIDPASLKTEVPVCSDEESAEIAEAMQAFGMPPRVGPTRDEVEAKAQAIEAARNYPVGENKVQLLELIAAAQEALRAMFVKANEHLAGEWNKAVVNDDTEVQQELISQEAPYWLDKSRRTFQQAFQELDRTVNRKAEF
jgi:uncharacterized protein YqgV (UPF0045/DUF77 family)